MKTLDEVIESITKQSGLEIRDVRKPDKDRFWVDRETYNDALQYLRWYKELADDSEAFAEWKENPPLTWDELRQMIGKPVWVEHKLFKGWRLVGWQANDHMMNLVGAYSEQVPLFADDLGKTWQAYRKER